MQTMSASQEYHPIPIPRRGELIAWISTLLVGITWMVSRTWGQGAVLLLILGILLLLSAALISLGNWVDRHTVLRLHPDGIEFHNGLRNVRLGYDQVSEIFVQPSDWGSRVQVSGEGQRFVFRTLGEVRLREKVQGRMGFERGEEILRTLVLNSGLQIVSQTGGGYTYARQ